MPPKNNPLGDVGLFKMLNASAEAINNRPLNTSVRFNGAVPQVNSVYADKASAFKGGAAGSALASTLGPVAQEAANAYMFRVPNYLNALQQPGINNKVNALQGALMVEGAGLVSDIGVKGLLALIAGAAPQTIPAMPVIAPAANFVKDYTSGITIDPMIMDYASKNGVGNLLPKSWNNPNNPIDKPITDWAAKQYSGHPFIKHVVPAMQHVNARGAGIAVGNMYNSIKSVFPNQKVKKDRPFVPTDFTP